MKGKLALCTLVLLSALLIVGIALACEDPRPPAPTCPSGQIETSPAVWVNEVPGVTHEERQYRTEAVMGCPTNIGAYTHHDSGHAHEYDCRWPVKIDGRWHYAGEITITPAGWGAWELGTCSHRDHNCQQRTVVDQEYAPGYWLPPVCETPVITEEPPVTEEPPIETEEPPIETEEPPIETEEPPVTEEPPIVTEEPPITTPEPPACSYTVTTYFQCSTGAAIWAQETGVTPGEGTNFVGYAPYNRDCGFCDGLTGIYHREWRNTCDGSGWDEGTWNMPEEFHELNGCPLGGRCVQ